MSHRSTSHFRRISEGLDLDDSTPSTNRRPTITPSSRLSQLSLNPDSTHNNNGQTKPYPYQIRVSDFKAKVKRAMAGSEDDACLQDHPNLAMVLGNDKITFDPHYAMNAQTMSAFNDTDEDDSSLAQSYSPERSLSASPDDHFMMKHLCADVDVKMCDALTDKLLDENYKIENPLKMQEEDLDIDLPEPVVFVDEHYDPSTEWLNHIYEDDIDLDALVNESSDDDEEEYDDAENRPPRAWRNRCKRSKAEVQKSSTQSSTSTAKRIPLQELPVEDSDDDAPMKKKKALGCSASSLSAAASTSSQPKTIRFMRSLSPTRDSNKGKAPA